MNFIPVDKNHDGWLAVAVLSILARFAVAPVPVMARTCSSTFERMRDVGRKSAEKEMSSLDEATRASLETFSCVYRGVILSCGEYDSSATIKRRSKLAFLWHARGNGFDESCCVHIHADHLRDRGLAIPHDWKFAMQNLDLQAIVNRKAVQTSIDADVTSLRCKLVGAPLHVPAPILERSTGSTIELNGVEVVLCARVTNEEWLVHMGSFDDNGELNARNPFQARDLLLKDLTAGNGVQLHKRIRQHLHRGQLRQLQRCHPELLEYVVALARYRAEVIRAERGSRAVQEGDVVMHFEQSPWHWPSATCDCTVCLLWTWHTQGMRRTGLTSIRLDELRGTDDKLPAPDGLGDEDSRLATSSTKAPCKYLGVKLACGNFEPDPDQRKSRLSSGSIPEEPRDDCTFGSVLSCSGLSTPLGCRGCTPTVRGLETSGKEA